MTDATVAAGADASGASTPAQPVAGMSVADLLPGKLDHLDAAIQQEKAANAQVASLPALAMGVVGERVDTAVRETLGCDVFQVLAQAWAKARELHEYADEARHPIGETSTMYLGEHALGVDLHPTVDVVVSGVATFELRFTLTLQAALRLAELTIRNRHIVELGKCDVALQAVLSYGGVPLHEPLQSRRVTLSGPMSFGTPGIPIP
ncbi:MAG TPA: hypothetical protein VN694_02040 [Caulobacteraceae bacterium]|nr:hypothetical protein [Caulobacteraceae bacterium]